MKRNRTSLFFTLLFVLSALPLPAFMPTCQAQQLSWEGFLDELTEEQAEMDEEQTDEWSMFIEELEFLHQHPLDLNRATSDELRRLFFMDDALAQAILDYRSRYGAFRSLGELMLIREVDWHTRQLLYLFTYVGDAPSPDQVKLGKDTLHHDVLARLSFPAYKRDGWTWARGLASHWRWGVTYGSHIQAGLRAETDAGEPMFTRRIKGWDAMGGFVQMRGVKWVDAAIIGDYKLHFGEGLVASNAYQFGKTSRVRLRMRNQVRPHQSSDEYNFMRGAAASFHLGKDWTLTAFYSWRQLDATIQDDNTIHSLTTSGLHRTDHELEQRHALTGHTSGGHIAWQHQQWQVGASGLYQYYNHQLSRGNALYQQIAPVGYQFGAFSVDYGYSRYPLYIHGETARSINAGPDSWATLNQLAWRMGATTQLTVIQRFYGKYYFSPYANGFSENSRVQNESGVCVLFDAERIGPISLSTFADLFFSPWPRYTMSRASRGGEGMLQLKGGWRSGTTLLARYQVKSKERSDRRYWSHRVRLTAEHTFSPQVGLRLSAWWHLYADPDKPEANHHFSTGIGIGPQLLYTSRNKHWRWTTQALWFHTDDYYSRLFTFEPHIQGTLSVPSLSGHGARVATLLRWQPRPRWQLATVVGCTRYFDRDDISTSFLHISSAWKTDISLQAHFRF